VVNTLTINFKIQKFYVLPTKCSCVCYF